MQEVSQTTVLEYLSHATQITWETFIDFLSQFGLLHLQRLFNVTRVL